MNVLEKILEEIDKKADYYETDEQGREHVRMVDMVDVEEIIRSHMEVENAEIEPVSKEFLKDCAETAAKYKRNADGWIPVEKKLPEVQEGLEDMYCPEFNVTIKGAERTTTLKYSWDGTWFDDYGTVYNVIAWQPLPERYKGDSNAQRQQRPTQAENKRERPLQRGRAKGTGQGKGEIPEKALQYKERGDQS